jgi:hypothetical protein
MSLQQILMHPMLVPVGLGFLVLSILIAFFWRRKKSVQSQIDQLLAPYEKSNVKQVIIPDGLGGLIEIEQMVLVRQGLVVLQTYPISGQLFGAENIEQWTQLVDGRSYKFSNPLNHLRNIQQSIKMIAPKLPVFTYAIFTADSHFPKGKPANVTIMSRLEQDLLPLFDEAPLTEQELQHYWQAVARIARKNGVPLIKELA